MSADQLTSLVIEDFVVVEWAKGSCQSARYESARVESAHPNTKGGRRSHSESQDVIRGRV